MALLLLITLQIKIQDPLKTTKPIAPFPDPLTSTGMRGGLSQTRCLVRPDASPNQTSYVSLWTDSWVHCFRFPMSCMQGWLKGFLNESPIKPQRRKREGGKNVTGKWQNSGSKHAVMPWAQSLYKLSGRYGCLRSSPQFGPERANKGLGSEGKWEESTRLKDWLILLQIRWMVLNDLKRHSKSPGPQH